MMVQDVHQRALRNLRISVTDRCNLRCAYCMPEEEYVWLPREQILHFEEVSALADVFMDLGVDKIRLTGGEPLLRRDLPELIRLLAAKPRLRDLLEGQDVGPGQPGVFLLGHAVGAAEIAAVRDGQTQVAERTTVDVLDAHHDLVAGRPASAWARSHSRMRPAFLTPTSK